MPANIEKMPAEVKLHVDSFLTTMKQKKMMGSFDIAIAVVLLLRKLVGNSSWSNAKELVDLIKLFTKQIMLWNSSEVIGNMARRVLKLVREEYSGTVGKDIEGNTGASLQTKLFAKSLTDDLTMPSHGLKSVIIDDINELISELETCRDNIAAMSSEYIHSNEIIMTYGKSRTVEDFLKKAAEKRKFSVIVAECAPFFHGQELALSLAEKDIETTVIADSAAFAMMSRVNKVIIGTHVIFADGGLKASNGAQSIALAAKHHSVPFIVCSGLFKLTPKFVCEHDQESFNEFVSPDLTFKFSERNTSADFNVVSPIFTYISADLVSLYISDVGGNSPSYLYRLVAELYQQEDYKI